VVAALSRERGTANLLTMDENRDREQPAGAAVTFATTEHFTLQTARASTVSEANGRALGFFAVLSSTLIALGFIGQMSQLGTAFYAFALVLLPAVAVVGVVTFERLVQLTNEDIAFAQRIARLRAFYIEATPELRPYLTIVPGGRTSTDPSAGQLLLTIAGMVAFVNSGIVGAAAGLVAAAASSGQLAEALVVGIPTGAAALALHLRRQRRALAASRHETIDALAVVVPA
jgi:hypothetical protein